MSRALTACCLVQSMTSIHAKAAYRQSNGTSKGVTVAEMPSISLTHVATPVGGQANAATRSTPLGATPASIRVPTSESKDSHTTRIIIARAIGASNKAKLAIPHFEHKVAARGFPAEPRKRPGCAWSWTDLVARLRRVPVGYNAKFNRYPENEPGRSSLPAARKERSGNFGTFSPSWRRNGYRTISPS